MLKIERIIKKNKYNDKEKKDIIKSLALHAKDEDLPKYKLDY